MPRGPDLESVQRWMQSVVRHPMGAAHAVAAGDVEVDRLIAATSALSSVEHLELYNRGYRARLLESLRHAYPAVLTALGEDAFDAFALDYLNERPSRSYTLGRLCDDFTSYLEETAPAREDADDPWAELVIELAALERAFVRIYDGPGLEGVSGPDDLPTHAPTDLAGATVAVAPSVHLMSSEFRLVPYFLELRRGSPQPWPRKEATRIVLARRDFAVTVTEVDVVRYELLSAFADGDLVADAAGRAEVDLEQTWTWLRDWVGIGWLASVDTNTVRSDDGEVGARGAA